MNQSMIIVPVPCVERWTYSLVKSLACQPSRQTVSGDGGAGFPQRYSARSVRGLAVLAAPGVEQVPRKGAGGVHRLLRIPRAEQSENEVNFSCLIYTYIEAVDPIRSTPVRAFRPFRTSTFLLPAPTSLRREENNTYICSAVERSGTHFRVQVAITCRAPLSPPSLVIFPTCSSL